jgi:hypothetical protein
MSKYVLTCNCGHKLLVVPGQAGGTVKCQCGATVEVPTLRALRELPLAESDSQAAGGQAAAARKVEGRTWGVRQGVMSACLILAAVCLAVAGFAWWTQPSLPRFDPDAYQQLIDQRIDSLTPVEAWHAWTVKYRELATTGFVKLEHPATAMLRQDIGQRQLLQIALLAFAGFCVVVAAILAATRTSGGGDKKTKRPQ